MIVTLQQTEKLFSGKDQNFHSFGFSMLLTRLKILHERDPVRYTLEDCNTAINAFLDRFSDIMGDDCEIIEKL